MVKAKAIFSYKDKHLKNIVEKGEIVQLTTARFKELSTVKNDAAMILVTEVKTRNAKDA